MNKVIMIGNLTRDPELNTTQNGIPVCKFSIAVNRRFGEEVDFFNIVTWRGLAENCHKYLAKGKKAAVVGELQTRKYTDKNGVERMAIEINADEVEFLSPRTESDGLSPVSAREAETLPF